MTRKLTFKDGSQIAVSVDVVESGNLAQTAYQTLLNFIEEELVGPSHTNGEHLEDDLLEDDWLDDDDLEDDWLDSDDLEDDWLDDDNLEDDLLEDDWDDDLEGDNDEWI